MYFKTYKEFVTEMEDSVTSESLASMTDGRRLDKTAFKLGYSMSAVRGLCEEVKHLNRLIETLEKMNKEREQ